MVRKPRDRQRNLGRSMELLEARQLLAVVAFLPEEDGEVLQTRFSAFDYGSNTEIWQDRELELLLIADRATNALIRIGGDLPGPITEWAVVGADGEEIPGWNSLVDWYEDGSIDAQTWGPIDTDGLRVRLRWDAEPDTPVEPAEVEPFYYFSASAT
ncbi:MAG: hypothetical protein KDB23_09520, partial [Planctomycetales bacterium]|nr:hypothetical protein [Planctomycetales bacterium]